MVKPSQLSQADRQKKLKELQPKVQLLNSPALKELQAEFEEDLKQAERVLVGRGSAGDLREFCKAQMLPVPQSRDEWVDVFFTARAVLRFWTRRISKIEEANKEYQSLLRG